MRSAWWLQCLAAFLLLVAMGCKPVATSFAPRPGDEGMSKPAPTGVGDAPAQGRLAVATPNEGEEHQTNSRYVIDGRTVGKAEFEELFSTLSVDESASVEGEMMNGFTRIYRAGNYEYSYTVTEEDGAEQISKTLRKCPKRGC